MRLLMVEDEPKTAAYVRKGVMEHGYVVDVANDGLDLSAAEFAVSCLNKRGLSFDPYVQFVGGQCRPAAFKQRTSI